MKANQVRFYCVFFLSISGTALFVGFVLFQMSIPIIMKKEGRKRVIREVKKEHTCSSEVIILESHSKINGFKQMTEKSARNDPATGYP